MPACSPHVKSHQRFCTQAFKYPWRSTTVSVQAPHRSSASLIGPGRPLLKSSKPKWAHRALLAVTGSTLKHAHRLLALSLPRTKQAVNILRYPRSTHEIVIYGITGHPLPAMDQYPAAQPALDLLL